MEVGMYGLIVDIVGGRQELAEVGEALAAVGYERIVDGVYICTAPRRTEMLAVHDGIEVLRNLPWIPETATKVTAVRIDEMGDITAALE